MITFRNWFYSPDSVASSGSASNEKITNTTTPTSTTTTTPTKTVKTPGVPKGDINFGNTITLVSNSWIANPTITIAYTTSAEFAQMAKDYNIDLAERIEIGSTRSQQTKILVGLDRKIKTGLKEVKSYIATKYGTDNAESYFNQFGIVHEKSGWKLPIDRQKRTLALNQMAKAIDANGFGANAYGKTFWADIIKLYGPTVEIVQGIEQKVADKVKNKNTGKKDLNKILTSLRFILRGNFPETYKQVYRTWGFLKENY